MDPAGDVVGEVTAVVGDEDADIFDGLRLETGDGEEAYVPAQRVGEIVEGRVALLSTLGELDAGDEPPGGAEVTRDRDAELG